MLAHYIECMVPRTSRLLFSLRSSKGSTIMDWSIFNRQRSRLKTHSKKVFSFTRPNTKEFFTITQQISYNPKHRFRFYGDLKTQHNKNKISHSLDENKGFTHLRIRFTCEFTEILIVIPKINQKNEK